MTGVTVTGGPAGVTAHYGDMLTCARHLRALASALLDRVDDTAGVAVHPDVVAGAVVSPGSAGHVIRQAGAATIGPHGLGRAAAHLGASAVLLNAAVHAHRALDDALAEAARIGRSTAAVPRLALGGDMPANWLRLRADLDLGILGLADLPGWARETVADLDASLYRAPWVTDGLIDALPALLSAGAGALLVTNPALFGLFSAAAAREGGTFPPRTFEDAVRSVLAAGALVGAFDDGNGISEPLTGGFVAPGPDTPLPAGVAGLMAGVAVLDRAAPEARIRVLRVRGRDALTRYVVEIPGTQDWSPRTARNPMDVTSDLRLMAGASSAQADAVVDALSRAGIPADAPVLLAGHSQGGITAAALAADPSVRARFRITDIVTAGSPIGRFPIPDDVRVLSIEHARDVVPRLDGVPNPDRPTWVTVVADPQPPPDPVPGAHDAPWPIHRAGLHRATAVLIDRDDHPSIVAARESLAPFLTDDPGDVAVLDLRLTRVR